VKTTKNRPSKREIKVSKAAMRPFFLKNFDEGKELYLKAIEKYPQSGLIYYEFARMLLFFQHTPAEALPNFIKAAELTPKATYDFYAAKCLYYLKQYPEAMKYLEVAETKNDFPQMKDDIAELGKLIQLG